MHHPVVDCCRLCYVMSWHVMFQFKSTTQATADVQRIFLRILGEVWPPVGARYGNRTFCNATWTYRLVTLMISRRSLSAARRNCHEHSNTYITIWNPHLVFLLLTLHVAIFRRIAFPPKLLDEQSTLILLYSLSSYQVLPPCFRRQLQGYDRRRLRDAALWHLGLPAQPANVMGAKINFESFRRIRWIKTVAICYKAFDKMAK